MTSSFHSFEKVSRWALLSEYFDKPLWEKWGYGKLLKKHFCWKLSNIFRFLSQTFVFSESGTLPLHTCVWELRFGKTCICREIKFIIVVKVFRFSCVCFKEIFPYITGGTFFQLTQNEISDKHENSIFYEHHLRQSPFKCTVKREICLRYLLRSFPSVSFQRRYFMFLIYLNGQKHVTQPLHLK